jgi:Flp pilus assembly pilin Flp
MIFRRLFSSVSAIASKATTTRATVAVGTAILMALTPARMLADQPLALSISWSFGPVATTLNITPPVAVGTTGVFQSTIHIHAMDNAKQPPFNADLIAIGQASDSSTLLGGLLPATIIVKQDLLNIPNETLGQAAQDAQMKTGVTVTFFQDATLVEYGMLVVFIALFVTSVTPLLDPTLRNQTSPIQSALMNDLCKIDLSSIGGSYGVCPPTVQ